MRGPTGQAGLLLGTDPPLHPEQLPAAEPGLRSPPRLGLPRCGQGIRRRLSPPPHGDRPTETHLVSTSRLQLLDPSSRPARITALGPARQAAVLL